MRPWLRAPRALVRLIAAAALLAATLVGGASPVLANHGESSADLSGAAQCTGADFSCAEGQFTHESVDGAHEFSASDEKSVEGEVVRGSLSYRETYDPDGRLRSVVVRGQIEAGNTNGGSAGTDATFNTYLPTAGAFTVTGSVTATMSGTEFILSSVGVDIEVDCDDLEPYVVDVEAHAGASYSSSAAKNVPISQSFDAPSDCDVQLYAYVSASTNRKAPGEAGNSAAQFELTIARTGEPGPCTGVGGLIEDGADADGHQNLLPGVRVELRRDNARVGEAVATDGDGLYCIPVTPGVTDPGPYQLRATLIDAAHEPPIFQTEHGIDAEAAWTEIPITEDNFGPDVNTSLAFAGTPERPWLPNVANIHWQSERMVSWILESLGIPLTALGGFSIETYSSSGTSYLSSATRIAINTDGTDKDDSLYADRTHERSEGPENLEWHEIGHHLAYSLGIAPTRTAAACIDRISHGGWSNATTCDSVSEGFAMFVATLASTDINANDGEGWGDDFYSNYSGLEENSLRPWSSVPGAGGTVMFEEDFAVANLLWDLADDTPDEVQTIEVIDPADPGADNTIDARDRVALGGANLVQLLAEIRPETVDAIYQGLMASNLVPENMKAVDTNLVGDDSPEVSALQELFLMHGFHATPPGAEPLYVVGAPIGRTDRELAGDGSVVPRLHMERVPGANVLLQNPSANPVTVRIEVTGQSRKDAYWLTVPAGSDVHAYLHPLPYWTGPLPESGLPACATPDPVPTSILITARGMPDFKVTGCEWLHAVVDATNDTAMNYAVAAGGPIQTGSSAAPVVPVPAADQAGASPVVLVVIVAAIVAGLGLLFVLRRRRGPAPG